MPTGGDFSDEDGRLYGVLPAGLESLCYIGVWQEQVAEFPFAREGEARLSGLPAGGRGAREATWGEIEAGQNRV